MSQEVLHLVRTGQDRSQLELTCTLGTAIHFHSKCNLVSTDAPTFSQPTNETLTLQVGSQMSLDCSASGNPLPEYSWKTPYTSKVLTETQSVFNSSFKHPGTYECTAANSQGTITKRFTVTQAPSKLFSASSRRARLIGQY